MLFPFFLSLGNGLNRLWEQMIAVLPQSSLEIARSLGAKHQNPYALFQVTSLRDLIIPSLSFVYESSWTQQHFYCNFLLSVEKIIVLQVFCIVVEIVVFLFLQEFQTAKGTARVADIGIARSNVPGAKSRKLGSEFARKLRTLLTTEDPNLVIE